MIETLLLMGDPGAAGSESSTSMFIMLGLMFVVMYFFLIRPQAKKAKEQRAFWDDIQKGDPIVTSGGIHGKVLKVEESTLLVEVDSNTKFRIEKSMVSMDFTQSKQAS